MNVDVPQNTEQVVPTESEENVDTKSTNDLVEGLKTFLAPYDAIRLDMIAKNFGVEEELINTELIRLISNEELSWRIDAVRGVMHRSDYSPFDVADVVSRNELKETVAELKLIFTAATQEAVATATQESVAANELVAAKTQKAIADAAEESVAANKLVAAETQKAIAAATEEAVIKNQPKHGGVEFAGGSVLAGTSVGVCINPTPFVCAGGLVVVAGTAFLYCLFYKKFRC